MHPHPYDPSSTSEEQRRREDCGKSPPGPSCLQGKAFKNTNAISDGRVANRVSNNARCQRALTAPPPPSRERALMGYYRNPLPGRVWWWGLARERGELESVVSFHRPNGARHWGQRRRSNRRILPPIQDDLVRHRHRGRRRRRAVQKRE